MSSILLGPLVKNKSKLNSIYNSNLSGKISMIEKQQARQNYNQPEYLKQFDELTFDNIDNPVGVNESYMTIKGINPSLQRNIDFNNGYSNFQHSDMHYDVVNKDNFTHNNMIPNTSKRDFSMNLSHSDRVQRKLQVFTGNDPNYCFKKEKVPLFEPMADLSWVNGMPVVADKLVNRYLPSNKNNFGDLPFQTDIKVRPGIEFQNQEGNYAVYRINPRNIDTLRSEINQKVTYENKPLETIKKGEFRSPDPTLTKHKLPNFRETKFGDLLPSKSNIQFQKQTGKYTNVFTQRNETDTYYTGHAVNTNKGDGPDKSKTKFEAAKRETYMNDPTHAINAVNNKPVMTNASSFTNYETQRATTNTEQKGPLSNALIGGGGNYTVDYKDLPSTTLRELMINGNTNIGIVGSQQQANYIFSNDMVLPTTHRQNTSHSMVTNARGEENNAPVYNNDAAKSTIRQNTSHSMVTNARGEENNAPVYNNDAAKQTIRQNISHCMVTNARGEENNAPVYNNDAAKSTIRQNTSHSMVTNARGEENNAPVYNNDAAKSTIRQNTSHSIVYGVRGEENQAPIYNNDAAKSTIRQNTSHSIVYGVRGEENSGYSELTDRAKNTIRQMTSYTTPEINIKADVSKVYSNLQDDARPTIKQTTLISKRPTGNISYALSNYTRDNNDVAKSTIRQTTENTQYIGHIGAQESGYTKDVNDKARPTIKQSTLYSSPAGRMTNTNMGNYSRDKTDTAKTTIKQTTLLQNYVGGLHGEVDAQISHEASNNMELDDRRELSNRNRAPNGKGDMNGPYINKENVRMNNRKELYNYVSHPHKPLDMSVTPTTSRNTIETVYSTSKPVIETSSYYINPNFINTLENNPLVNDIYHQKNN
jgi:hypothetical protein